MANRFFKYKGSGGMPYDKLLKSTLISMEKAKGAWRHTAYHEFELRLAILLSAENTVINEIVSRIRFSLWHRDYPVDTREITPVIKVNFATGEVTLP
jgi:hypothetical protein